MGSFAALHNFKHFPESHPQQVRLIQGVQFWQHGHVRPRSSASGDGASTKKRTRRTIVDDEEQAINLSTVQKNSTTDVVMKDVKKKKRSPARRLEVPVDKCSIWDALSDTKVNMSFKEWLTVDKQAAKDLCDGIRFIHGRKPRTTVSKQVNAVNLVELDDEEDEEGSVVEEVLDGYDDDSCSESYLFDSEFEDDDDNGYHSDTSFTQYPYNPESVRAARPFAVQVLINGELVEAIADTGASVSVISKPLAQRLNLPVNKDLICLSSSLMKGIRRHMVYV